jgi:hypothetical protein
MTMLEIGGTLLRNVVAITEAGTIGYSFMDFPLKVSGMHSPNGVEKCYWLRC